MTTLSQKGAVLHLLDSAVVPLPAGWSEPHSHSGPAGEEHLLIKIGTACWRKGARIVGTKLKPKKRRRKCI